MSEASRLRAIAAAAAAAAERWSLPAVEGPVVGQRRGPGLRDEAAESHRQSERSRGYEEGLASARAEMQRQITELQQRVRRFDAILSLLAKPLAEVDEEVHRQLVLLALAVGKQLARRELKSAAGELIALIREAVSRLPATAREVRVHLHPEDAALVREHLSTPAQERAWSMVEDPAQSRGGCLVRTESSQIDARFESRVNAIIGTLLGDERGAARAANGADPSTAES